MGLRQCSPYLIKEASIRVNISGAVGTSRIAGDELASFQIFGLRYSWVFSFSKSTKHGNSHFWFKCTI